MNTYVVLVNHKQVAELEANSIEDAEAEVEIMRVKNNMGVKNDM